MPSILQRYITKSYLSAWVLGMVVLSFVLSIGLLVKATQLVVKGLPASLVLKFLAVSVPESLTFTIPLASLVSALLLFGRLSADGEISAMRACGVNVWRIMAPLVAFGVALAALSSYVNAEIAPTGSARRHDLVNGTTRTKDLVKLLEPGHFIHDFNGVDLWFESREGDVLKNLLILEKTRRGGTRETRCAEATLEIGGDSLVLDMRNVRISPFSDSQPGTATADHLKHAIRNAVQRRALRRKACDLTNGELRGRIAKIDDCSAAGDPGAALTEEERDGAAGAVALKAKKDRKDVTDDEIRAEAAALAPRIRSTLLTELNRRFALGMAPLAFILLGMPLGIRASRRESNVGIAISLGVMLLYYAFMIAAKSLAKHPAIHPHLVIWTPSAVCFALAAALIRKNQ